MCYKFSALQEHLLIKFYQNYSEIAMDERVVVYFLK
jgi:hypothetical protein